jgi:AAA15 family ATPase/GTPase
MITRFRVQGFKNFKDELSFDLTKIKQYEFNKECIVNSVINKAIIYGPNSSGKSNLGFALFDIVSHMSDKEKHSEYYINYSYGNNEDIIVDFKYEFKFDNYTVRYNYGKKSLDKLVYENLWISNKKVVEFDKRVSPEAMIDLEGTENLNKDLKNSKISVIKYILKNSILINNPINDALLKMGNFVDNMLYFRSLHENAYIGYEVGSHGILENVVESKDNVKDFEIFLRKANIICKLDTEEINGKNVLVTKIGNKSIGFWQTASTGTKSLSLFYYWMQKFKEETDVKFLFIDEYDAFYHSKLSKMLVQELKKIKPQTIVTTHNTSIMSNDLLRPDCYFIIDNNRIYPLYESTDKDLRKAHNIEKMFKAGAFDNA